LHAGIDYALIESHHYLRDIKTSPRPTQWKLPHPPLFRAMTRPRDASILGITASSEPLKGTISGTPSYATTPGSRKIQELWTVRFEGSLTNGDCGSWVVDAQSGELFGHIVDGSPEFGVAHIVPTYRIFEDARTRFGLDLEVYQTEEPIKTQKVPIGETVSSVFLDVSSPVESKIRETEPVSPGGARPELKNSFDALQLKEHTALKSIDENSSPVQDFRGELVEESQAKTKELVGDSHDYECGDKSGVNSIINVPSPLPDLNNTSESPNKDNPRVPERHGGGFYMAYLQSTSIPRSSRVQASPIFIKLMLLR
jgi:hypothetical protein